MHKLRMRTEDAGIQFAPRRVPNGAPSAVDVRGSRRVAAKNATAPDNGREILLGYMTSLTGS